MRWNEWWYDDDDIEANSGAITDNSVNLHVIHLRLKTDTFGIVRTEEIRA